MKKITILLGALALTAFVSCKNEEKTETTTVEPVAHDTTVVVHETETVPVQDAEEEQDGTSVSVDSDGMKVDSKSGEKKTDVNVSDDGAAVEIKR
ncbi:MAG TPA: hypothetical protein VGB50_00870 [Flavobacterium sp.]|jgi:hypothetical protein